MRIVKDIALALVIVAVFYAGLYLVLPWIG